jgi:glyoxylase-like metal-dependent hydrolase (beta-lactamase superfamily II)
MTTDISLAPGSISTLAPGVRRLVAPNAGMMTGPGTNTYLLGVRDIAVIDPGPALDRHVDAIVDAAGLAIRWVLVTHTHPDHSPAATPLARRTGAALLGRPAPGGQHQDATFRPDRILEDGEVFATGEFELHAIHTPGHASNHLCYLHSPLKWLFTGDHIINGSTVVIDPPDGNMTEYLQSLERLKDFELAAIAPGHGEVINTPYAAIDWIVEHRLERERRVAAAVMESADLTTRELVPRVYADVDTSLYEVAERSLLAHLEKLEQEGTVRRRGERWGDIRTNEGR